MKRKGQFDFDEINIAGLIFALIAFGVGILVSNSMGSGVAMRIIAGAVCAIAGYVVGSKIIDSG